MKISIPSSVRMLTSKACFPAAQKYTQQTASTTLISRVGMLPGDSAPNP
jgi:hypothetical protein